MKQAIFNCIPNVDADPFEHVSPPEEEWNKYYTVEDSKLSVRDIALEVKVSLESLLMYNGDIGLQPQSRLRRGRRSGYRRAWSISRSARSGRTRSPEQHRQ